MSTDFAKTFLDQLSICIDKAIIEDIGHGDQTSLAIFDAAHQSSVQLIAKEDGVFAGLGFVQMLFERHAPDVQVIDQQKEGSPFKAGDILLQLKGNTQSILSLERIALNALQRMSGIAKITQSLQQKIAHTSCQLLDTRKTTPNFRIAEKWAVAIGGGTNHRMGLYDAIMVKDNHIDFVGDIPATLLKVKSYLDGLEHPIPVIVETRNLEQIDHCMDFPWVERILLDNMTPKEVQSAVSHIAGAVSTEASGNITPQNIVSYAETGVDFVSLGFLTHSASIVDMSLVKV
jgi:nicotinate-nucleotide pyrophosphorylase (carboxylating)